MWEGRGEVGANRAKWANLGKFGSIASLTFRILTILTTSPAPQNAVAVAADGEKCHFSIVTLEIPEPCEAERIEFVRVPAKFESQVLNFSEFEIDDFTITSS